jgi:hypothetical protein
MPGPRRRASNDADGEIHHAGTDQPPTYGRNVRSTSAATKVPFLLSYTAAEAGDPKDFAKALETLRSNGERALPQYEANGGDEPMNSFPMYTQLFGAELFQLDMPQGSSNLLEFLPQAPPGSNSQEDVLRCRASDLVALLEEVAEPSRYRDIATALLTPTNLGLCIENFFQYAYRHVPIVHKPSFEVTSADPVLLLSVFVVGAIWSYPRDTYFMVLEIVELAERCIFENIMFKRLQDPRTAELDPRSSDVLPLLQAATMIVSISFAFPDAEHRRRFRNDRFVDLMSVTRALRLGSEKIIHASNVMSFEWTDYIISESSSRQVRAA